MNPIDGLGTKFSTIPVRLQIRNLAKGLLPLLFAVILTIIITIYREELMRLAVYGYTGIFIACVAANSTVFLPAPSSAIVLTFA